ncbi:serine/threonine-protein kinase meng-po-like [Artemia franciscana]|uniref:Protein kinase domain-containing protein n=1 Tax=Artemia franciscana TaxID=6661 RepID=A0AA88L8F1_ARTSF|nr:hypothetical protein QYM36_006973 [Artemia franciscana]
MGTLSRRNSSIHRVREFPLRQVELEDEYDVIQTIGAGWFAKVYLSEHKKTRQEIVLKALQKDTTSRKDFFRELHYSYFFSPHPNVIDTYDVAFETRTHYIFAQEYAPLGDLTSNIGENGLGEINSKRVLCQIASALDFVHSKDMAHRDLKMDNILVFRTDFTLVKLCDFGSMKKVGAQVARKNELLTYCPPEVATLPFNVGYFVHTSHDIWQFGILIFVCLTGSLPWQKADQSNDRRYSSFFDWQQRKTNKIPTPFKDFSSRLQRFFRKVFEPDDTRRTTIKEFHKYYEDKWLTKHRASYSSLGVYDASATLTPDGMSVNFSIMSVHSCLEEKNKLLRTLTQFGIETTVDHTAKKERIREWIRANECRRKNFPGPMSSVQKDLQ